MKRLLTGEEVLSLIEEEDNAGVCNLIQEIFSLNVEVDVIGDFDEAGNLKDYEVKIKDKKNELP